MLIRLSIPARQALAKLTLPALVLASIGLVLLGKADAVVAERARIVFADALAPIYAAFAPPLWGLQQTVGGVAELFTLRAENARLRQENERLQQWQILALALDAENRTLKANLNWMPEPAPSFVTARVVADSGGVYARAALLALGPNHPVTKGQIALDQSGLVGRVTEGGARSARLLLITDLNSRIPVILDHSRAHAILGGTNAARPRLLFWPEGAPPAEGETVVTSAEAGVFPPNLPVGTVHYAANHVPEVEPAAHLDRLEIVRVFDYGLHGLEPGEVRGRPVAENAQKR